MPPLRTPTPPPRKPIAFSASPPHLTFSLRKSPHPPTSPLFPSSRTQFHHTRTPLNVLHNPHSSDRTSHSHSHNPTSSTPHMSACESEFSVRNAANETLAGVLTSSRELVSGDSLLILCHGFTSSKRSTLLSALTVGLIAALPDGYGIARFDFAGNGDSAGRFSYSNYTRETEDLRSVVQYLRGRELNVHAVLGHSKGAAVVLLYAGKYGDVKYVVNLAGRLRMDSGIRERFGQRGMTMMERGEPCVVKTKRTDGSGRVVDFEYEVRIEDVRERLGTDVMGAVRKLPKGVKVLTVHGGKDETIPVQDGKDIHAAVEDGELVVFEEAGHSFEGFEQKIVEAVDKFCFGSEGRLEES